MTARRLIQACGALFPVSWRQESLRTLAKRYGINRKTVAKWKNGGSTADRPTNARSTWLSIEEEAVIVAFRRHTLLTLRLGRRSRPPPAFLYAAPQCFSRPSDTPGMSFDTDSSALRTS